MLYFLLLFTIFLTVSCDKYSYSTDNQTPDAWEMVGGGEMPAASSFADLQSLEWWNSTTFLEFSANSEPEWIVRNAKKEVEAKASKAPTSHLFYLLLRTPPKSVPNFKEVLIFPVYPRTDSHCHPVTDQLIHMIVPEKKMLTKVYQCGMRIWLVPAMRSKSDQIIDIDYSIPPRKTLINNATVWLRNGTCLHKKETCKLEWHVVGTHDNRQMNNDGEFVFEINIGVTEGQAVERTNAQGSRSHETTTIGGNAGLNKVIQIGFEYAKETGEDREEVTSRTQITVKEITRQQTRKFKYSVGGGKKMVAEQEILLCDCFGYETAHVRARDATPETRNFGSILIPIVLVLLLLFLVVISYALYRRKANIPNDIAILKSDPQDLLKFVKA